MSDPTMVAAAANQQIAVAEDLLARGRRRAARVSDVPKDYIGVTEYATRHSVNRKTVFKWMGHGLVDYYQVLAPGSVKPLIRVRNVPPRASAEQIDNGDSPRRSSMDATA